MFSRSQFLFEQVQKIIPGGVNSPVRAFKGVGGTPVFFKSGQGAYLKDEDNNRYIDYVGAWGPMILGHTHPAVVTAIQETCSQGFAFGAPTLLETKLAEKICELMPNIEQIRLMNSGTEATMTAIRLARAITQRDLLIKFNGNYHGHSDSLLVQAGSGALTLGIPSSPGVPKATAELTLSLEYNNLEQIEQAFSEKVAAVIVEPIAGNMGCIPATQEFLDKLRSLCDQYQALLIFDEVMTGFRVGSQGAQALYNIKPDLTTLGKIIGGGLPIGALGGLAKHMQHLAPQGAVYQAGTQSGNPLVMAAGLATLNEISKPGFYEELSEATTKLVQGLLELAKQHGIQLTAESRGGMFGLFFADQKIIYPLFFHELLKRGVYFAPSAFESVFVSSAHGSDEIQQTLDITNTVFKELKQKAHYG